MAFSIDIFRASFAFGPADPSKFYVQVNPPAKLLEKLRGGIGAGAQIAIPSVLAFRCDMAELPGKAIATLEDNGDYGPIRKISYGSAYTELNLEFIETEDLIVKTFFHLWSDLVSNDNITRIGAGDTPNHDIGYYEDYVAPMQIYQIGVDGSPIAEITLEDAFPIAIAPVPLSWDAGSQLMKIRVSMAFRYFRQASAPPARAFIKGPLEGLINRSR